MRSESLLGSGSSNLSLASGMVEKFQQMCSLEAAARFGHFLFCFFRLQKLTRIPYRHPRVKRFIVALLEPLSIAILSAARRSHADK